uniref:ensconsin-like isoform X3 n=1 Tax=Myxine glutinosa TaxID=7769 RepID=UPI00358FAFD9
MRKKIPSRDCASDVTAMADGGDVDTPAEDQESSQGLDIPSSPHPTSSPSAPTAAKAGIDVSSSSTDERVRLAKERREELQRQLVVRGEAFLVRERHVHMQHEQAMEERRRRLCKQRQHEDLRRAAVDEKRKARLAEDKARYEAAIRRAQERHAKHDPRARCTRVSASRIHKPGSDRRCFSTVNLSRHNPVVPVVNKRLSNSYVTLSMHTPDKPAGCGARKKFQSKPGRRSTLSPAEISIVSRLLTPTHSSLARSRSVATLSDSQDAVLPLCPRSVFASPSCTPPYQFGVRSHSTERHRRSRSSLSTVRRDTASPLVRITSTQHHRKDKFSLSLRRFDFYIFHCILQTNRIKRESLDPKLFSPTNRPPRRSEPLLTTRQSPKPSRTRPSISPVPTSCRSPVLALSKVDKAKGILEKSLPLKSRRSVGKSPVRGKHLEEPCIDEARGPSPLASAASQKETESIEIAASSAEVEKRENPEVQPGIKIEQEKLKQLEKKHRKKESDDNLEKEPNVPKEVSVNHPTKTTLKDAEIGKNRERAALSEKDEATGQSKLGSEKLAMKRSDPEGISSKKEQQLGLLGTQKWERTESNPILAVEQSSAAREGRSALPSKGIREERSGSFPGRVVSGRATGDGEDNIRSRAIAGQTNAEDATRALAEKRRLAREQREREEQERLLQEEAERRMKEEIARRKAEERARRKEEALRLAEEREHEEEEERLRAEEERLRKEQEEVERQAEMALQREMMEQKAREEAERQRDEREKQMQQEEMERQQRKKRLEQIMQRTRRSEIPKKEDKEMQSNGQNLNGQLLPENTSRTIDGSEDVQNSGGSNGMDNPATEVEEEEVEVTNKCMQSPLVSKQLIEPFDVDPFLTPPLIPSQASILAVKENGTVDAEQV